MKRLLFALTAAIAAPRLFAGALFIYDGSLPSSSTEEVDTLPDVEVLSQKIDRSISSSIPLYKIDRTGILNHGITDISDALKRLPGVNLRDYGGAGGLKTVSVRGLGASHTGVSYDGVVLSDLRSGEIDLSRYSLNDVSSISLTPGDPEEIFIPARNASSGASIAISSLQNPLPEDKKFSADIRMKTGSFGLWHPYFRTIFSNASNLSISAMAEFTHAKNNYPFTLVNGDYISKEKRENSRMNSLHTEINSIFIPGKGSSLNSKLYYYDNSRQLPGPVKYYVNESHEKLHDRNFFFQSRYRNRLSSVVSIAAIAKFNWSSSRYSDKAESYPNGFLDQYYIQREVYSSGALLILPMTGLSLDYSADWFFNNLSSNLPSDSRPYRHSVLQTFSAKYNIGPVTILGRMLYSLYLDRWQEKTGKKGRKDFNRFSPSLAISVSPFKNIPLYVRASYKNIYRMPTFNELYFDNYGSTSLQPEITDQLNIGFTFSSPSLGVLENLSATIDGYYNSVRNKIVAIPYNLFKWTMTNLGKARIFGLDISLDSKFKINTSHSILFTASYSYQRAQPRTSPDMLDWMKQIAYTPLNSGSASISWLNPWVSIAVHTTTVSARYTTSSNLPSTRIAGYGETGLAFFHTFSFHKSSLELRADILNLFDKQYEVVAKYPMPGRNWTASIRYSF
ncbi:MAG: TonB-dependent receptor [Muribaculaceae bacterium]|nr:TonB-dependent receptor [Muribaculaceae bacterium]